MKLTTRYVYDEHNRLNYAICDTSKWGSGERYFRRVATGSGGGHARTNILSIDARKNYLKRRTDVRVDERKRTDAFI